MQFIGNALFCPYWEAQRTATYYVIETVKCLLLSGRSQRKTQPCLRKVESKTTTAWRISVSMCALYLEQTYLGTSISLKVVGMMTSLSLWMYHSNTWLFLLARTRELTVFYCHEVNETGHAWEYQQDTCAGAAGEPQRRWDSTFTSKTQPRSAVTVQWQPDKVKRCVSAGPHPRSPIRSSRRQDQHWSEVPDQCFSGQLRPIGALRVIKAKCCCKGFNGV